MKKVGSFCQVKNQTCHQVENVLNQIEEKWNFNGNEFYLQYSSTREVRDTFLNLLVEKNISDKDVDSTNINLRTKAFRKVLLDIIVYKYFKI